MKFKYYVWHGDHRVYFPYTNAGFKEAVKYCATHNLLQKKPFIAKF